MDHFADRLIVRIRELGHPLCVGLDPHLDRIPPLFRQGSMAPADPRTATAVGAFLDAVLDRVHGRVAVVKPQIAFFERLGWRGLRILGEIVKRARDGGLSVLLDAKRGDIGSTAAGYAEAYLGPEAMLPVDAMTVNPYLGADTLEPFYQQLRLHGRGLFVLVKTSNPGSGDFQDRVLAEGGSLCDAVAAALAATADDLRGPLTGWSALGVVAGATYPGDGERIRRLLPHSLFLVPGYGAQGGDAQAAVRGFVAGPGGCLEGGIVNSSRGILFPAAAQTDDRRRWDRSIDEALDRAIAELSTATTR
ncbi:MAG: orotidine-5'-phosphate decarboxylase [Thermoanaerobaculia bacterium]